MQNLNYDLIKVLLGKLDDHWRITKHYTGDAEEAGCKDCLKLFEKIVKDDQNHIEMLKKELGKHISEKKFE